MFKDTQCCKALFSHKIILNMEIEIVSSNVIVKKLLSSVFW